MIHTIKRTIQWCGPYKKRLYLGFVLSFFNAAFIAMPILLASYSLTLILQQMNGERTIVLQDIYMLLGGLLIAILGRFICSYYRAVLQDSIGYEVSAQQRIQVGQTMKRVPLHFFRNQDSGTLTSAVTTDLSFIEMHALKMLDTVVNGAIGTALFLCILSVYNIGVAVIALIGIGISGLFLHQIALKAKENAPIQQQSKEQMIANVLEYIRGISIVKSYKLEGIAKKAIEQAFQQSKDINIKIEKNFVKPNTMHLIVLKCASIAIVATAVLLTMQNNMLFTEMIFFTIFSFVIFKNIEVMNDAIHVLTMIDETLDKLQHLNDTEHFIDSSGKDIPLTSFSIQFHNVHFSYDQRPVLKNINFLIEQNQTVAIVGPSGSGKSTICHLIARFDDVNKGQITIGDVPIMELSNDALLQHISIVFQKVYLFQDTIRNNIRFGKPSATDLEVIEAAKKARCHDFIMKLPNGYDTVVSEGGATLSGGERQRISIARSIIKDAPIVILDEATASIDPENEHLIQEAIAQLVTGKTLIIIAHRLKTIEQADQIIVLNEGEIVQQGTHRQLIKQTGLYQHFMQMRAQTENWHITKEEYNHE